MKFSAAGSPEKGLTIPVEGRGGHWIVKLPSQRYPLVPENEHSMMQFARMVGIDTAETGLVSTLDIGERYAKPILWMAVYRIILRAWDSTRKTIWHGGVVLYRSR